MVSVMLRVNPVFNAILQKARALCGVDRGTLLLYDGEYFRAVATHGLPDAVTAIFREPNRPAPGELRAQLVAGARYAHSADLAESEGYRSGAPSAKIVVDIGGTRSVLGCRCERMVFFLVPSVQDALR